MTDQTITNSESEQTRSLNEKLIAFLRDIKIQDSVPVDLRFLAADLVRELESQPEPVMGSDALQEAVAMADQARKHLLERPCNKTQCNIMLLRLVQKFSKPHPAESPTEQPVQTCPYCKAYPDRIGRGCSICQPVRESGWQPIATCPGDKYVEFYCSKGFFSPDQVFEIGTRAQWEKTATHWRLPSIPTQVEG